MKQLAVVLVAFGAGIVIGSGTIGVLKAQGTKKPAYVVAEVAVFDPSAYQAYRAKAGETLQKYHARVIARAHPDTTEGSPTDGIIVIAAFESLPDAETWYSTPPYTQPIADRQNAANTRLYIVEGLPQ